MERSEWFQWLALSGALRGQNMHQFDHLSHSAVLWMRIVTQHHHLEILQWAQAYLCWGGAWCKGLLTLSSQRFIRLIRKKFQLVARAFFPWFEVTEAFFLEPDKSEKRYKVYNTMKENCPFEIIFLALLKVFMVSYDLFNYYSYVLTV